jgi:hypothetical protein
MRSRRPASSSLVLEGYMDEFINTLSDGTVLAFFADHIHANVVPTAQFRDAPSNNRASLMAEGSKPMLRTQLNRTSKVNLLLSKLTAPPFNLKINFTSQDITFGNRVAIMTLTWNLVRSYVLSRVSISHHPELVRMMVTAENALSASDLLKLPEDQLLLHWCNYHLRRAGSYRYRTFGNLTMGCCVPPLTLTTIIGCCATSRRICPILAPT